MAFFPIMNQMIKPVHVCPMKAMTKMIMPMPFCPAMTKIVMSMPLCPKTGKMVISMSYCPVIANMSI